MHVDELARSLNPKRTVLFLGSGASIDAGGLTGPALASALWSDLVGGEPTSEDLAEITGILTNRLDRTRLIQQLRRRLGGLRASGPMRALVAHPWAAIYTTNYDHVVEDACKRGSKPCIVIRSNFDYSHLEATDNMPILKLHGCLSQDVVDGHLARIVITEEDYELTSDYREALYRRLEFDLATHDVVVIGHSLRDAHVKRDILKAASLKQHRGAPGRVVLLVYERDDDRAQLYERKGVAVCTCSLEQFTEALANAAESAGKPVEVVSGDEFLAHRQAICTLVVSDETHKASNPKKLFHGGEATYADIEMGLTFERSSEDRFVEGLTSGPFRFGVVTGVAGVGKTTLARRIMHRVASAGHLAWEWRKEFNFRAAEWLRTDALLREHGKIGLLLVDECLPSLRQVNELCLRVSRHDVPALKLLLTANHAQWVPRIKAPEIFRHGIVEKLSQLGESEIIALVSLLDAQRDIRALVPAKFSNMPRMARVERLRRRCQADMFVCLKHVFSYQSLDQILLTEYAGLDHTQQDIYRLVSFLEASCGTVHRQLILRLVDVFASSVQQRLAELDGLIDEYDIDPEHGLYGWRTRHSVIAQTISQYKFADDGEIADTLRRVVEGINPTVWLELKMLREMCGSEYGINQIPNPETRIQLLQRIIALVPSERVPRHRLITALIELERYDDAEGEIEDALRVVKRDPPLQRYKVRLQIAKARHQDGLMKEDRIALLRQAERLAQDALERFPDDKRAYMTYADVGDALARLSGDKSVLHHAVGELHKAAERLLDPEFAEWARRYERRST